MKKGATKRNFKTKTTFGTPLGRLRVPMVEIAAHRELVKFGKVKNVSRALGGRRWAV